MEKTKTKYDPNNGSLIMPKRAPTNDFIYSLQAQP
jgi:hypothetical protein